MNPARTTVVVINRPDEDPTHTLDTLANQTVRAELVVIRDSEQKGANWARNEGFRYVRTQYVLFSDNDILWYPHAIEAMESVLNVAHVASYAYGAYSLNGKLYCDQIWDPYLLKQKNYISTMSLIRAEHFPGFDEDIQRLQDWDLWLTMLERGWVGVYVGEPLFVTHMRPGISHGPNALPWKEAERIVKDKHNLP